MKAARDLRTALGQDEPLEVSQPKRPRAPDQLVGVVPLATADADDGPSRAEIALLQERAEHHANNRAAASVIDASIAQNQDLASRLVLAESVARHTEAEASKNEDLRRDLSTAQAAARQFQIEAADYKKWSDTHVAQLKHAQQQLAGALARIGELDEQVVVVARDLEGSKSRVEIAELATARALSAREQTEKESSHLMACASQEITLLKSANARVKEQTAELEARAASESTRFCREKRDLFRDAENSRNKAEKLESQLNAELLATQSLTADLAIARSEMERARVSATEATALSHEANLALARQADGTAAGSDAVDELSRKLDAAQKRVVELTEELSGVRLAKCPRCPKLEERINEVEAELIMARRENVCINCPILEADIIRLNGDVKDQKQYYLDLIREEVALRQEKVTHYKARLDTANTALAAAQEDCVKLQDVAMAELRAHAVAKEALESWEEWFTNAEIEDGEEEEEDEEPADDAGNGAAPSTPVPPAPHPEPRRTPFIDDITPLGAGQPASEGVPVIPAAAVPGTLVTAATPVGAPPGLSIVDMNTSFSEALVSSKAYERLEVPALPKPGKVDQWLQHIAESLVRSGGYSDDKELAWLFEVKTATAESLAILSSSSRFQKADIALAAKVESVIMKSEASLRQQMQLRKVALQRTEFRILKGRELIWMVLDFFKLNKDMAPYYDYQDIGGQKWKGDDNIEAFYREHLEILQGMRHELPEPIVRRLLYDQVRQSKRLAIPLHLWDALPEGDAGKTHSTLLAILAKRVGEDQMEKNWTHRAKAPNAAPAQAGTGNKKKKKKGNGAAPAQQSDAAAPAPAPKAKAKAKAKGQGKGKGTGGSGNPSISSDSKFCFKFLQGSCTEGANCKFLHVSESQKAGLIRAVSPNTASRSNNNNSKGGKAKGGKGKKGGGKGKGKAAPAEETGAQSGGGSTTRGTDYTAGDLSKLAPADLLKAARQLQSRPAYCSGFTQGTCKRGDSCERGAHLDEYSVAELKSVQARRRESSKSAAAKAKAA